MSRIGKQFIRIPEGVTAIAENGVIRIKGPRGEIARSYKDTIAGVIMSDGRAEVTLLKHSLEAKALWGTYASHIKNMIHGVTEGFSKKLEIEGIGYRAQLQGDALVLSLGYSHPIEVKPKKGIQFQVEKNTIIVSGIDKEKVGETASFIRSLRKPEPYKGKGIHYEGEVIRRKAGKKAATTAA
ncbi:MAG: 50S ribosomal protein L6 [Candidatus Niyogibacteria bacterium]|nr:50S ribosomal protein L6 [Candidatus Niyogibacteria bacterium]